MSTVEHDHIDPPTLPTGDWLPSCPAPIGDDGTACGAPLLLARNVRGFYPVRSMTVANLVIGECCDVSQAEDEDVHLFCTVGHDWAVPAEVEFE